VRRRLGLAIAAVATAAVVLFAVPLAIILGGAHRTADLLRLQRDTVAATRQIDLSGASDDTIELPHTTDALGVYDRAGRLLAGRGPGRAGEVVRRALRTGRPATAPGGGPLVVAVPLVARESVVGAVRAQRARGEASGDTAAQRLAVAGLALLIIAAAIAAAVWLGSALARPLERVAAAASRLGHGDFSVRPPPAGIAEVDAVGAALSDTARRLEDLIGRERAFSANASHQLRTPLQALRIELEAAEMRGDAPPEVRTALIQVDRLEATIATLLAVARDVPRRHRSTDVGAAVEAVRHRWHGSLAAVSRPLRTERPGGTLLVDADERVVDQILDVLLENAARHGAGAVTVTTRNLDGWLAIDVGDEGPGFASQSEDVAPRRPADATDHGLGLPLAQSLAHAEGGRLAVSRAQPAPIVTLFLRSVGGEERLQQPLHADQA
jgi:signal transduction histidine kinase